MTEIVFLIEDDPDGGYTARALGESIFTQADDMDSLRDMIRDAVRCHFPDESSRPKVIRSHEVLRNPVSLRNRVSGMYFIQLKTAISDR
jgi:predicted RNase H-like HicB family nuclease